MGQEGSNGDKGETGLKGKEGPPGNPGLTGVRVSVPTPFFFFYKKLLFIIFAWLFLFKCISFCFLSGSWRETWQNWRKRQTRTKGIKINTVCCISNQTKKNELWHHNDVQGAKGQLGHLGETGTVGKTGPPGFVGQKGSRGTIGHVVKWNSNLRWYSFIKSIIINKNTQCIAYGLTVNVGSS